MYMYIYVYVYIYIYIYSTICRHACFGVLRLVSAAWYTSRYAMTFVFVYMQLALPSACGIARAINASRHAQSVMGPECSNNHEVAYINFHHLLCGHFWIGELSPVYICQWSYVTGQSAYRCLTFILFYIPSQLMGSHSWGS